MSKTSMGQKLEKQVENLKGGLKDIAEKFTAEDHEPRTDAMAGPVVSRPTTDVPDKSRDELYAEAQRLGVKGRSRMTKSELAEAVRTARR